MSKRLQYLPLLIFLVLAGLLLEPALPVYADDSAPIDETSSAVVPLRPTTISPTGEAVTSQPQFTWKASSGATKYQLLVYLKSSGNIKFNLTIPSSRCSYGTCRYTHSVSLSSGYYYFRVKAGSSSGWSSASASRSFKIRIGGKISCQVFPSNNIWNTRIDQLPVHKYSAKYVTSISNTAFLHPDFGSGLWEYYKIGKPYNLVLSNQPRYRIEFLYASESDPGPYPIPATPLVQSGTITYCSSDCHLIIVDQDSCKLYELYNAIRNTQGKFKAIAGAIWDLNSNALRPNGWTSADAAGLPILPGLVRYDEVAAGAVTHAIRFTSMHIQKKYVWPARHYGTYDTNPALPPMGQRFRLKASVDISKFSTQTRVILTALKRYGLILTDVGAPWYIGGAPDSRWNNSILVNELHQLKGSDFEAVDATVLMINSNSGVARSQTSVLGASPSEEATSTETLP